MRQEPSANREAFSIVHVGPAYAGAARGGLGFTPVVTPGLLPPCLSEQRDERLFLVPCAVFRFASISFGGTMRLNGRRKGFSHLYVSAFDREDQSFFLGRRNGMAAFFGHDDDSISCAKRLRKRVAPISIVEERFNDRNRRPKQKGFLLRSEVKERLGGDLDIVVFELDRRRDRERVHLALQPHLFEQSRKQGGRTSRG